MAEQDNQTVGEVESVFVGVPIPKTQVPQVVGKFGAVMYYDANGRLVAGIKMPDPNPLLYGELLGMINSTLIPRINHMMSQLTQQKMAQDQKRIVTPGEVGLMPHVDLTKKPN